MTKANWKEAPHDAETWEHYRDLYRFCKKDFYFDEWSKSWEHKAFPASWTILEHRPRIIAWEDMKEGMVVRCVGKSGSYSYSIGRDYTVGWDEHGDLGPIDDDGWAPSAYGGDLYTFELVSESEQDPQNWEVLIDSPEGEDEEWTHTYNEENCYIKYNEPDRHGYVIIVLESEGYDVALPENLKPIKPTITKAEFELLEKTRQYFDIEPKDFAKFMNDYEVK